MTDTTPPTPPPDSQDRRSVPERASGGQPAAVKRSSAASTPPPARGPKATSHSMADMLIDSILADRYKLLRRIGEGAMGWVFVAEHVEIGKKVAVKVLRPSLCRLPEAVSRFRREARSATQIGSKHIVDVTDFGTTDTGSVFFVMEYLQGEDLSTTLKNEKFMPWKRVLHVLHQLCEALQAAHDSGIIHRDVKPANFYRVEQAGDPDFIKILDFGIARLANPQDSIVTQTGVVMGTPDFMAPEQAMGRHVDHRADIYSLGASAYALLTGRPPFEGANEYDVIYKQLNDDPTPPSEVAPVAAAIPRWIDGVILKALRKDPQDRYETMQEFADAIGLAEQEASVEIPAQNLPGARGSAVPGAKPGGVSPAIWVGLVAALAAAGTVGYMLLTG
ncbi:MAG: serine/threonine protein kinase [Deltaproteobacteria bacterium]|nr:serine/threonine protein kinase [Deltaproteobacteria bacterium]